MTKIRLIPEKITTIAPIAIAGLFLAATLPANGASNLVVLEKYFFGEINIDGRGSHKKITKRIPNIPGRMCFGWVIKIKPLDKLAKITEILTLPAEPKDWEGVEDDPYSQTTTFNGRKIAKTIRFMALGKGELENTWCLSEGDPNGPHKIIVLYDTQILAEFDFEVYE